MIQSKKGLVYFPGDTGYDTGFIIRATIERHDAPNLALIPIGAYAPRWFVSVQHCRPDDAVRTILA